MNELFWFCLGVITLPVVVMLDMYCLVTVAATYDIVKILQLLRSSNTWSRWECVKRGPGEFCKLWRMNYLLDRGGCRRIFGVEPKEQQCEKS